jgi:uncharacterized protein YuzE
VALGRSVKVQCRLNAQPKNVAGSGLWAFKRLLASAESSRRDYYVSHQQGHNVLEKAMKVKYDEEVDVLTIEFSDAPVEESDEDKPGVILDYDKDGNIVGMEILNASKRVQNPKSVEYAVA